MMHFLHCLIPIQLLLLLRMVGFSGNHVSGGNIHSYDVDDSDDEMPLDSLFYASVQEYDSCSSSRSNYDAFCNERQAAMIHAITIDQDLSNARYEALEAVQAGCDEHVLAKLYQEHADRILFQTWFRMRDDDDDSRWLLPASRSNTSCTANQSSRKVQPLVDRDGCWNFGPESEQEFHLWEQCCSLFWEGCLDRRGAFFRNMRNDGDCVRRHGNMMKQQRMCCEFHNQTFSYLHLPVLKELALRIRIGTDEPGVYESYNLEQDGFLRKFDTSTVLWPAGYLLSLCISAPNYCGIPELLNALVTYDRNPNKGFSQQHPKVLELAAGIGAPSIAMARLLHRCIGTDAGMVIATDNKPQALALIASNALCANASVSAALLDYLDWSSVIKFREQVQSRFKIIIGAALIIEPSKNQTEKLWKSLDALLDWSDRSVVVLVHTVGLLPLPGSNSGFQLVRSISGDRFNMKTRWGHNSEFEISVFQRSQNTIHPQEESIS